MPYIVAGKQGFFLFYYLRTVGNACYDWGCSTDLMMPSQVYIAVDSENQTQVSK